MALHSFGGREAPPTLIAELQMVAALPASGRTDLWTLLEPHLGPTVPESTASVVSAFCEAHGVSEDELVPVVRGCRDFFRTAAGLDVGVEAMTSDLDELFAEDRELAATVLSCYAKALPRVRALNIMALMGEYGAVLDDVNIRMDYVQTSSHDTSSMVPIAMMSLRYRTGDQPQHLAVQLPLPVLAKLKAMCDAIVGQAQK